jgi:hypothetical protein
MKARKNTLPIGPFHIWIGALLDANPRSLSGAGRHASCRARSIRNRTVSRDRRDQAASAFDLRKQHGLLGCALPPPVVVRETISTELVIPPSGFTEGSYGGMQDQQLRSPALCAPGRTVTPRDASCFIGFPNQLEFPDSADHPTKKRHLSVWGKPEIRYPRQPFL